MVIAGSAAKWRGGGSPLVFWGAGVKPGVHRGWVDISDVAPTLAALLDIRAPAGADAHARAEVLK